MAAFELPLVGLTSTLLTLLAMLGRRREAQGWVVLFAPGAIAWMVGTQGLLFRRQPDYMVGYLFEARRAMVIAYLLWCAVALALAWTFAVWTQRARQARPLGAGLPLAVALMVGLGAIPLFGRLAVIGSTLEFREGVVRPLAWEPAARTLLALTAIGSFLPVAGACLLVGIDGLRSALRQRQSSAIR